MTAGSPESEAVIVVRSTSASPDEVVNTEDLFGRQEVGLPRRNKVKNGEITMARLEIARLDNSLSLPENGRLELVLEGGA